ncbi:MAG: TniQ family protein [Thiobacillus sp.]|nr:TniQ family protein [Thiobacillus sp.]
MIPRILPDELLHGYRGRLRWVLGTQDIGQALQATSVSMDSCEGPRLELEVIAQANELSLHDLVCRHTHWSLLKSHPPHPVEVQIKAAAHRGLGVCTPCSTSRKGAWFCPQCVSEDLEFWQLSYWRLSHHIPGAHWCLKHQTALKTVSDRNAFDRPPHHWRLAAPSLTEGATQLQEFPTIVRYVEAFNLLTDQSGYLDRPAACRALRRLAGGGDDHSRRQIADFTLTKLAHANLDVAWLSDTLNVAMIDPELCWSLSLCRGSMGHHLSPIAMVIISTLLHETAEEAASMLGSFFIHEGHGQTKTRSKVSRFPFKQSALKAL